MSLRTLILAAVGCALIATSMGTCYAMVIAEEGPPLAVAVFFGGVIVGGGSLALATFRLWNRGAPDIWPSMAQSTIIVFVGVAFTLGSLGTVYLMDRSRLGYVPLAGFFVGIAYTIGAMVLLFWAIRADSKR